MLAKSRKVKRPAVDQEAALGARLDRSHAVLEAVHVGHVGAIAGEHLDDDRVQVARHLRDWREIGGRLVGDWWEIEGNGATRKGGRGHMRERGVVGETRQKWREEGETRREGEARCCRGRWYRTSAM